MPDSNVSENITTHLYMGDDQLQKVSHITLHHGQELKTNQILCDSILLSSIFPRLELCEPSLFFKIPIVDHFSSSVLIVFHSPKNSSPGPLKHLDSTKNVSSVNKI